MLNQCCCCCCRCDIAAGIEGDEPASEDDLRRVAEAIDLYLL